MNDRVREKLFGGVLIAALAAVSVLGFLVGRTVAAPEPEAVQATVGTAFTYQGWLTDGGAPVNDNCDFTFELWDAASGGNMLGTVNKSGETVADGRFTVLLDFGISAFGGNARWLATTVDCGSGAQVLAPRQRLSPAPYAIGLVPGAIISGTVSGDAVLTLGNSSDDGLAIAVAGDDGLSVATVGDDGLNILDAGGDGVEVQEAGDNGLQIGFAGQAGVNISGATEDGVSVFQAGTPSSTSLSSANNGFEVAGAEGNGLFVGRADGDGVQVATAGDAGVEINAAANEGVIVESVGSPSTTNSTRASTGFEVHGSGSFGAWVGRADTDGVQVASAGDDGFEVLEAGGAGFQVDSAANHGVFVREVGSPSTTNSIGAKSGFEVQGSAGNGLSVGRADGVGVAIRSAGGNGVFVDEAGFHGVSVGSADNHGVFVNSAGQVALFVNAADADGIFVEDADADGDGFGIAGYFDGDVTVTGNLSKGGGGFTIDHPLDPENQYLTHSFVESPERMNVYNGNVTTDADGYATVTLPDYFEALNGDYRYQLTVIGTFAQAIVAEEIENNQFVIQTDQPEVKVSWQVTGVRQDPYAVANPLQVEEEKPAYEQGSYMHPEAYGQSETMGVGEARIQFQRENER